MNYHTSSSSTNSSSTSSSSTSSSNASSSSTSSSSTSSSSTKHYIILKCRKEHLSLFGGISYTQKNYHDCSCKYQKILLLSVHAYLYHYSHSHRRQHRQRTFSRKMTFSYQRNYTATNRICSTIISASHHYKKNSSNSPWSSRRIINYDVRYF